MPTRYLYESITTSEHLDRLTAEQERCWYRLLVVADDFGRFDGRPAVIRGRCFPLKDDLPPTVVGGWLRALADAGLLQVYEVRGQPFLQILRWKDRQRSRAVKSKFPDPPVIDNHPPADAGHPHAPDNHPPADAGHPPVVGGHPPADAHVLRSSFFDIRGSETGGPGGAPDGALSAVADAPAPSREPTDKSTTEEPTDRPADRPPGKTGDPGRSDSRDTDVSAVLARWRERAEKPKAAITGKAAEKRRARIRARMAEGWTVERLMRVVDGMVCDSFLMGSAPKSKPGGYREVETVFRDNAQCERLEALADAPHRSPTAPTPPIPPAPPIREATPPEPPPTPEQRARMRAIVEAARPSFYRVPSATEPRTEAELAARRTLLHEQAREIERTAAAEQA